MTLTAAQQDGLQQILRLMEANGLSPADVKKSYAERQKAQKHDGKSHLSRGELILRLFAYLGGTLVFAGLCVFIQTIWDDIGSLPRVVITFGSGFTAYLCGLFFATDIRFQKVATPAFILAFLLQPFGLFVLLKEYTYGNDTALGSMVVFGPLLVQQALTFLRFRMPSLLFFSLAYLIGFCGSAVEYFDTDRGFASLAFGTFLLLTTINMQMKTKFRELTPLFFIISTGLFFAGIYYYVGRTVYDPVALSLILSLLGFAVFKESKTLYVISLLYMSAYFCGVITGDLDRGYGTVDKISTMLSGTSLVLTGYWLSRSSYISLYPLWMFVGTCMALGGFFALLHATPLEPLSIAASAGGIYVALLLRSRAVLGASVIATISFIISYTAEHFANMVGWPLLLIFIGIIILASGFLFARLAGRIKQIA